MSEEIITSSAVVDAPPQISQSDAFAMPLDQLAQVAGINQPQSAPAIQPQPAATQPQATPGQQPTQIEPFAISQDGSGFVLKYATGEVYKGASEVEVYRKAAENAVRNIEWAKQVKKQYEEFQQNPSQPVQMPQEPLTAEMETQAAMEQAKAVREYFQNEILTKEMKAQIVAEAVGVPADQLPQVLSNITETSRKFTIDNAIMEFRVANPSFVETPQNTQAMLKAMEHLPPNYTPTPQDLQGAWARALYEGWATPATPAAAQPKRATPPPMPMMSGSHSMGTQDAWQMPLEDLAKMAGIIK